MKTRRSTAFFPRLKRNIVVLREAHRFIGQQERSGHHVSSGGEWLFDNIHLVQAQTRAIHDGLPLRYYRDLPVLVDAHLEGLPRIYGVAWAFVAHTDSAFDEALLVTFVGSAHDAAGGAGREPAPTGRGGSGRQGRENWPTCGATRSMLQRKSTPSPCSRSCARGVEQPFALQVMQRLHSDSSVRSSPSALDRETVRAALARARALPDPAGAQAQQQAQQQADEAADNLSVSNVITALRLLDDIDCPGHWPAPVLAARMARPAPPVRAAGSRCRFTWQT